MKAVVVEEEGADFETVERDVPEPGPEEVRIDVEACGICHSDVFVKGGGYPGVTYPRVPGHEVVGRIDETGEEVDEWENGDYVGVGWHGGHCFTCGSCREGDFIECEDAGITGLTHDGGYAEYMTAPRESVASVPEALEPTEAAPILCAGITTYNALRNSGAKPGDTVAVQGLGGLGHLGVQYAVESGYETVALSRGPEKRELADELGADGYIDTEAEDPTEALTEMGGADVILSTAPSAEAMEAVVGGLGVDGNMVAVGVPGEDVPVPVQQMIGARQSVSGWPSGQPSDSEDSLEFSALRDITPMVDEYPLEEASEAYESMLSGEARFRAVLDI